MGLSFKMISDTVSARDCQEYCQQERNKCAGWSQDIRTKKCELFYVVEKCQSDGDRRSGFCEAMYDIKTYNGKSITPKICRRTGSTHKEQMKKIRDNSDWKYLKRQKGTPNLKHMRKGRLFGALTQHLNNGPIYPWVCSLRTFGFRGQHRCSVTLLSAPPNKTVLVSAAHCNYICKDARGKVLDICCCRADETSCGMTSSFCGVDPRLTLASPSDLQIVCGEHNIDVVPEAISIEVEVVLNVLKFSNHPKYSQKKGPISGYDISVYHVDDTALILEPGVIYPACLPRPTSLDPYNKTSPAILAAWRDPKPKYFSETRNRRRNQNAFSYKSQNLLLRHARFTEASCTDPDWMNSNTYYPSNVQCFSDPTLSSCLLFGSSGSSVVRVLKDSTISSNDSLSNEQFAWIGPLSMSKGCDRTDIFSPFNQTVVKLGSENPGIFTDGSCYLDWIARSYDLRLDPKLLPRQDSCSKARGDINDRNKTGPQCRTSDWSITRQSYCNFNQNSKCSFQVTSQSNVTVLFDSCKLFGVEGYAETLNLCIDSFGKLAQCANNCLGVDPNSVVVRGTAVLATSAFGGLGALQGLIFLGSLTTVGTGAMLSMGMCPGPLFCRVQNRCVLLVTSSRGLMCPPN